MLKIKVVLGYRTSPNVPQTDIDWLKLVKIKINPIKTGLVLKIRARIRAYNSITV